MKKFVIYVIFTLFIVNNSFSFTYSPDFVAEGLVFDISVNYGKIFKNGYDITNFEFLFSPYPSHSTVLNIGFLTSFSRDIKIFDIYAYGGFTYYPFNKILSFSCNIGIGASIYALLNHFPYLINAKVNIDIPIYKKNNITLGVGIQHRNSIKLIGYIKSDNYYGIYNSYYVIMGYRFIIR